MRRRIGSTVAVLVALACVLAGCATQVQGRATAASSTGAGPTSSARETARAPSTTSRPPATTTSAPAQDAGLQAVCQVLGTDVPPTISGVNAFTDALDTSDPADDDPARDSAVQLTSSVAGSLGAALGSSGIDPAGELATAAAAVGDALTRISSTITASDSDGFNTAIDDFNASYESATSLCAFV